MDFGDIVPIPGIMAASRVGVKDRRTHPWVENGVYSPILHPYEPIVIFTPSQTVIKQFVLLPFLWIITNILYNPGIIFFIPNDVIIIIRLP